MYQHIYDTYYLRFCYCYTVYGINVFRMHTVSVISLGNNLIHILFKKNIYYLTCLIPTFKRQKISIKRDVLIKTLHISKISGLEAHLY